MVDRPRRLTARVTGRRENLLGVRSASTIEQMGIVGRGVGSLEGIERFGALEHVTLSGTALTDFHRLAAMSGLESVSVHRPAAGVDLAPLARLARLDVLDIEAGDEATARALARIDFGGLKGASEILLHASHDWGIDISLRWITGLERLRVVALRNFGIPEADEAFLCGEARHLDRLHFQGHSWARPSG
jgi:hypothetical protein